VIQVAWRLSALGLLVAIAAACGQGSRTPCSLAVPGYDARGNRIPFRIVSVVPEGEVVDLLKIEGEYRVSADNETIHFPETFIGMRPLVITLQDPKGRQMKHRVGRTACQQRASFQYGLLDTGDEVAWAVVSGQLAGCRFQGDWWVRAMPLFGQPTYEGYVQPDGKFQLETPQGTRHIVVFGSGKIPVKVQAFDVVVGGKNDMGVVDLSGACPP